MVFSCTPSRAGRWTPLKTSVRYMDILDTPRWCDVRLDLTGRGRKMPFVQWSEWTPCLLVTARHPPCGPRGPGRLFFLSEYGGRPQQIDRSKFVDPRHIENVMETVPRLDVLNLRLRTFRTHKPVSAWSVGCPSARGNGREIQWNPVTGLTSLQRRPVPGPSRGCPMDYPPLHI